MMQRFGLIAVVALLGCDQAGVRKGSGADLAVAGARDGGSLSCGTDADQEGCSCSPPVADRGCYEGPAGTRGMGLCHDGTQSCSETGEFSTWAACAGATKPVTEVCDNGSDDDCDGLSDCKDPDCATAPGCVPECAQGAVQLCYTGPAGTSGVGICKPGKKTCDATGHYGPCTGDVTPGKSENIFNSNCTDGLDNDCNGLKDCQELGCLLLSSSCAPTVCTAGATQSCYTGPSGTSGVGVCKAGSQTCASDGKSWGPCTGQVTPGSEGAACTDGLDNDCNGLVDCADPACLPAPACCVTTTPGSVDETIWANSSTDLYKLDPTTFAMTHVGGFGISDMTDIAVTPAGALYGISFSSLYAIDKTSGKATYIAAVSGSGNNGLTFLPNGTLLAADGSGDVKRIDPTSGAVTSLGNFGNGLSSSGDLVAVNGVMYGISSTSAGGSDASQNNVLMTVDVTTGKATIVGPIGFGNVWGLGYVNKRVIALTTGGDVIEIDPLTAKGTKLSNKGVQFWGAGMSPNVPVNTCP